MTRDAEADIAIARAEAREDLISVERDKASEAETIRSAATDERDRYRALLLRVANHDLERDGLFALVREIRAVLAAE